MLRSGRRWASKFSRGFTLLHDLHPPHSMLIDLPKPLPLGSVDDPASLQSTLTKPLRSKVYSPIFQVVKLVSK